MPSFTLSNPTISSDRKSISYTPSDVLHLFKVNLFDAIPLDTNVDLTFQKFNYINNESLVNYGAYEIVLAYQTLSAGVLNVLNIESIDSILDTKFTKINTELVPDPRLVSSFSTKGLIFKATHSINESSLTLKVYLFTSPYIVDDLNINNNISLTAKAPTLGTNINTITFEENSVFSSFVINLKSNVTINFDLNIIMTYAYTNKNDEYEDFKFTVDNILGIEPKNIDTITFNFKDSPIVRGKKIIIDEPITTELLI
ncbi:hypothetical protein [uncultured Clostridium sp.]|uniref:hypothetical protein n=1 Tax=uncultured Clostridium sp. TaxID=59620 RepID=UPI002618ED15|nr:hypothetical protein [uncultured Clostridium sp.]